MKTSEKIKQEIETLLDELKKIGYKVVKTDDNYSIYNKEYAGFFTFNEFTNLKYVDDIFENLIKLKLTNETKNAKQD